jgi:uncharacterized membrane protein YfcA
MKTVLGYYLNLKRENRTKREIEHNTYGIVLAIGIFIGVILSKYISIAYWVGVLIVLFPIYFYRQKKKIIELERKDKHEW